MFLFIFFGDTIIKVIYERGMFSEPDTIMTSEILMFYSLSIIFYAAYGILNKIIYSVGLIFNLLFITISGIAIKLIFNFIFVESMQQNGLALSTTISFIYFFSISYIVIYKKFSLSGKSLFYKELFFQLVNGSLVLLIINQTLNLFIHSLSFNIFGMMLFLLLFFFNLFVLQNSSFKIIIKALKSIYG
jgi:putative peptidoglycan lipid II flippase